MNNSKIIIILLFTGFFGTSWAMDEKKENPDQEKRLSVHSIAQYALNRADSYSGDSELVALSRIFSQEYKRERQKKNRQEEKLKKQEEKLKKQQQMKKEEK